MDEILQRGVVKSLLELVEGAVMPSMDKEYLLLTLKIAPGEKVQEHYARVVCALRATKDLLGKDLLNEETLAGVVDAIYSAVQKAALEN